MNSVFLSGMHLPKMRTKHTSSATKRDLIDTNMRSPLSLQLSCRNIQVHRGITCFGTSYLATIAVRIIMGEGPASSVEWRNWLICSTRSPSSCVQCREEKAEVFFWACAVVMNISEQAGSEASCRDVWKEQSATQRTLIVILCFDRFISH